MTIREIAEKAEQYAIELLNGRRRTRTDQAVLGGMFGLSRIYRALVQLRLQAFEERIFRQRMLGCLVVSIGNLTVGGTGKTPVVEVFARTLIEKGRRVAILSRGYRSRSKPLWQKLRDRLTRADRDIPPKVVSDGRRLLLDSNQAGDEPYMLASNVKKAVVLVDKDRVKSGRYAIRRFGADTLILDDGFQYLRLRPHLNILLIDSTNPFHNHHLLPRGLLREPIRNLRRANIIFLTKSNGGRHLRHLKGFVTKHNPRAEIIECTHKPEHLVDVYSHEIQPLEALRGKRVAAISGIAVPESFENVLRKLGATVVHTARYADHHRYRLQEIIDFQNRALAAGAQLILTTEKDAVRFPKLDRRDVPVLYLRVRIDILTGQESFNDCITRLCFL